MTVYVCVCAMRETDLKVSLGNFGSNGNILFLFGGEDDEDVQFSNLIEMNLGTMHFIMLIMPY